MINYVHSGRSGGGMSPVFGGSEPTPSPAGPDLPTRYQGLSALQVNVGQVRDFLAALDAKQQCRARLRGWQRFLAGAGDDNAKVPREGIAGRELDATQRQALLERFVGNLHEEHAQVAMGEVEKQDVFRSIMS
ncbi:DUF3500 domain-containing protein [Azotobacter chroococcum]|nr:DUF3500 domain-containing protein [Azotobacter chroococcum]